MCDSLFQSLETLLYIRGHITDYPRTLLVIGDLLDYQRRFQLSDAHLIIEDFLDYQKRFQLIRKSPKDLYS